MSHDLEPAGDAYHRKSPYVLGSNSHIDDTWRPRLPGPYRSAAQKGWILRTLPYLMAAVAGCVALQLDSGVARAQQHIASVEPDAYQTSMLADAVETHYRKLKLTGTHLPATDQAALTNLLPFFSRAENRAPNAPALDLLQAERRRLLRDVGVRVQAGYLENLEPGSPSTDEAIYRRRGQVEVQWDLLRNGLYDNRLDARIVDLEMQQTVIEETRLLRDLYGERAKDSLGVLFAAQKLPLLRFKREVLHDLIEVSAELYKQSEIPRDDLMSLLSQQAQLDLRLQDVQTETAGRVPLPHDASAARTLPILDLRWNRVESVVSGGSEMAESIRLRLQQEKLMRNPLRQVSLQSSVRYNTYQSADNSSRPIRDFVSLGLSVTLPVPLGAGSSALLRAREEQLYLEQRRLDESEHRIVQGLVTDYRSKLSAYLDLSERARAITDRIEYAAARQRLKLPEFSASSMLRDIALLLEARLEMLDRHEDMYRHLVELWLHLEEGTGLDILEIVDPTDVYGERREYRSVSIDTPTFSRHTNAYLLEELRRQGVGGHVYLDLTNRSDVFEKQQQFVWQVQAVGLDVFLRSPSGSSESDVTVVEELVQAARALGASGVHVTPALAGSKTGAGAEANRQWLTGARQLTRDADLMLSGTVVSSGSAAAQPSSNLPFDHVLLDLTQVQNGAEEVEAVAAFLSAHEGPADVSVRVRSHAFDEIESRHARAAGGRTPKMVIDFKAPERTAAYSPAGRFTIVIASERTAEAAARKQLEVPPALSDLGEVTILQAIIDRRRYHRVAVGRFSSRREAETALEDLRREHPDHQNAWILDRTAAEQAPKASASLRHRYESDTLQAR